jgi:hypothetical protein
MKNFLFLILLISSTILSAQEKEESDSILNGYLTELKLNSSEMEQFTSIYNKYKTQLNSKSVDNNTFNKLNKERDLELYKLFTEEEREIYRRLKRKLEPSFGFRM